jgi:hypothetical protein
MLLTPPVWDETETAKGFRDGVEVFGQGGRASIALTKSPSWLMTKPRFPKRMAAPGV